MEKWKPIPQWEGYFQISNYGRVRNRDGLIRKTIPNNKGYEMVTLKAKTSGNKPQTKTIHRLVALAFIPNPNNYTDVNHIDENKYNNHYTNLQWMSHRDNCNHGNRNEIVRQINLGRVGKLNPRSKPVMCIETGQVYESMRQAELITGINNIRRGCNGTRKTVGGFHWKFVKQEEIEAKS